MVRSIGLGAVLVLLIAPFATAGNVLEVKVSDCDGPAKGCVLYSVWDEAGGAYVPLHSRDLRKGADRIGLAPGTYQVRVVYTEALPHQEAVESEVRLGDGETRTLEFYFAKGAAVFQARDNDWPWGANSRVFVYRRNESSGEYELLRSLPLPDRQRKTHLLLAPGEYKVGVQYKETLPQIELAEHMFTISDGEVVSILSLFRHGSMPVRRKHAPLERKGARPNLMPNEALTERLDNKG